MDPIDREGIWVPKLEGKSREAFQRLQRVYYAYAKAPYWWLDETPPDKDTYDLIAMYVTYYVEDPVSEHMAKLGPQGVSLFYHEGEELRWLIDNGYQPFMRAPKRVPKGLKPTESEWKKLVEASDLAHARGLIEEHRYLQKRSPEKFLLGDLVKGNPVASGPKGDLQVLEDVVNRKDPVAQRIASKVLPEEFRFDPEKEKKVLCFDPAKEKKVAAFYKRLPLRWYKRLWLLWLSRYKR